MCLYYLSLRCPAALFSFLLFLLPHLVNPTLMFVSPSGCCCFLKSPLIGRTSMDALYPVDFPQSLAAW